MKIMFISHIENDCFLQEGTEIELKTIVDQRTLAEIFVDEKLKLAAYDILFVHPENPTDPGWKIAPAPSLIFSGGFRKPVLRKKVAHLPREIAEKHWPFIIEEFARCHSFVEVLEKLQEQEREKL